MRARLRRFLLETRFCRQWIVPRATFISRSTQPRMSLCKTFADERFPSFYYFTCNLWHFSGSRLLWTRNLLAHKRAILFLMYLWKYPLFLLPPVFVQDVCMFLWYPSYLRHWEFHINFILIIILRFVYNCGTLICWKDIFLAR